MTKNCLSVLNFFVRLCIYFTCFGYMCLNLYLAYMLGVCVCVRGLSMSLCVLHVLNVVVYCKRVLGVCVSIATQKLHYVQ